MKSNLVRISLAVAVLAVLAACSSLSNLPDRENVKVSRNAADEDCKALGKITGRTSSAKGTAEEALKDLEQEAANKGANYVKVEQYSGSATAVTGVAYNCP